MLRIKYISLIAFYAIIKPPKTIPILSLLLLVISNFIPIATAIVSNKTLCGTQSGDTKRWCYNVDIYPIQSIEATETVIVSAVDDYYIHTYFHVNIRPNGNDCINPTIDFIFEESDFSNPGTEYLQILRNDSTEITKCTGTADDNCGTWISCLSGTDLSDVTQINKDDTYTITIYEPYDIGNVCGLYSIHANLTIKCDALSTNPTPSTSPTNLPTQTPTNQTPSTSPTTNTESPTAVTPAPTSNTTAPTKVTISPTSDTEAPTAVTPAPTSNTEAPTAVTLQPTSSPTGATTDTSSAITTTEATSDLTNDPTNDPTSAPTTSTPTTDIPATTTATNPTPAPTGVPTIQPTLSPITTLNPSKIPTASPALEIEVGVGEPTISPTLKVGSDSSSSGGIDGIFIGIIIAAVAVCCIVCGVCILCRNRKLKRYKPSETPSGYLKDGFPKDALNLHSVQTHSNEIAKDIAVQIELGGGREGGNKGLSTPYTPDGVVNINPVENENEFLSEAQKQELHRTPQGPEEELYAAPPHDDDMDIPNAQYLSQAQREELRTIKQTPFGAKYSDTMGNDAALMNVRKDEFVIDANQNSDDEVGLMVEMQTAGYIGDIMEGDDEENQDIVEHINTIGADDDIYNEEMNETIQ